MPEQANEVHVRPVTPDDVSAILSIAQSLAIGNTENPSNEGFLVSGYKEEDYLKWIGKTDTFLLAEVAGEVVGFVLAYRSTQLDSQHRVDNVLLEIMKEEFVVAILR